MISRIGSSQHRHESGQDLVEYALVAPLLFLLVFSIVEAGALFLAYNSVANAAREGARAVIVPPGETCNVACLDERAETAARRSTAGLNPAALEVEVSRTAATVTVVVRYQAPLLTGPAIAAVGGAESISLQVAATMQME